MESGDADLNTDRDEMFQLSQTGPNESLIAGLALNMLEEATNEPKREVAMRTPVPVVIVPAVGIISGLVALVG